jgi:hypothetical protein
MADIDTKRRHGRACPGHPRADEAHVNVDARHKAGHDAVDDTFQLFEGLPSAEQGTEIHRANAYLRSLSAEQLDVFLNGAAK